MDATQLKGRMLGVVDEVSDLLLDTSHQIHAHPELNLSLIHI